MENVTVKGSWLNACGKGKEDKTFSVVKSFWTSAPIGSGFERMFVIDMGGYEWTVALCRLVS